MALNSYLQRTLLLLNDKTFSVFNELDLTTFINMGRGQIAGQSECCRNYGTLAVAAASQQYNFSSMNPGGTGASGSIFFAANPSPGDTCTLNGVVWTFVASGATGNEIDIGGTCSFTINVFRNTLNASTDAALNVASYATSGTVSAVTLSITYKTGGSIGRAYTMAASVAVPNGPTLVGNSVEGVINVRQITYAIASGQKPMHSRSFPWFNQYVLSQPAPTAGPPSSWSQYGQGALGSIFINLLDGAYTLSLDEVVYPGDLVDDSIPEVIPYQWTDAVPFFAAYYAAMTVGQKDKADMWFNEFEKFVSRARAAATPSVLGSSFAGTPDSFAQNRLGIQPPRSQ